MSESKIYIQKLFSGNNIIIANSNNQAFETFVAIEENVNAVKKIQELQNNIMSNWKLIARIKDIIDQPIKIPNGTVGKIYETKIDFLKFGWDDIIFSEFENLEQYGLNYNDESKILLGNPTQSGDFKINLKFRVQGENENTELHLKSISLVINADPKSLWKELPSNKEDAYWKEDNVQDFKPLGDRHILVSSKRGRSHGNVGSFRDDDYSFKHFEKTGWSIVCVADGAGSAKLSRQGSKIACEEIINYFTENLNQESLLEFDTLIKNYQAANTEETQKGLNIFLYNNLGKAALSAHKKIQEFANVIEVPIKDFHSTLIFALIKKYEFGYAILTFGVGDCPIGLLNKDLSEIKLMNWLDVGEFGGGTRFITMPEIFSSDKFSTRFGFKLIEDFSYLMLMTDGIYDPKFVVEANLEKVEKWQEFIADLQGNNDNKDKIVLDKENKEIANQLSTWMDFWSAGNHDDRTLAIIF
jgi:serine/threonine protein phosphatase PrpC